MMSLFPFFARAHFSAPTLEGARARARRKKNVVKSQLGNALLLY